MVPDGRANATIHGTAECIDTDPLRAVLTADVFARLSREKRPDPTSIVARLDEEQRTVLRINADKFLFNA
jgi:hypothetical protein